MRAPPRRLAAVLLTILALELVYVILTGGQGPLGAVGPAGFAVRLLLLAALLAMVPARPLLLWLLLLLTLALSLQRKGRR